MRWLTEADIAALSRVRDKEGRTVIHRNSEQLRARAMSIKAAEERAMSIKSDQAQEIDRLLSSSERDEQV